MALSKLFGIPYTFLVLVFLLLFSSCKCFGHSGTNIFVYYPLFVDLVQLRQSLFKYTLLCMFHTCYFISSENIKAPVRTHLSHTNTNRKYFQHPVN